MALARITQVAVEALIASESLDATNARVDQVALEALIASGSSVGARVDQVALEALIAKELTMVQPVIWINL